MFFSISLFTNSITIDINSITSYGFYNLKISVSLLTFKKVKDTKYHFGFYFMSLKLMDIKVSQVTSNKYIKYNNNKNKTYTRIN